MRLTARKTGLVMGLALLLLALIVAPTTPARAAAEDVAMYYDSLAPYGTWVDYGNYGPVWYPTQGVTSNWRPYMDGRWVPTDDGWVFETSEPWGWATYHFGNWMPTTEYGWVWNPGSTWYPSTAAWRTSDDYVGWAPIPPPDYVPEPAYYPTGGYYPGQPALDLLSAPFWIFAQAANFLLGFNQPYGPAYSYYNSGYLAPYSYVPFLFGNSLFLSDYYYPPFAPNAFYSYGPSFPYVSRVTNINIVNINNFAHNANFHHIRNGMPPADVMNRHHFIRDAIPASVRQNGRFQAQRVANPAAVGRHLAQPGVVKPPANVPKLTQQIPKGVTPAGQPAARGGAVTPTKGVTTPGRQAPTRAPARELRAPTQPPTGEFRAPGREQAPAVRAPLAPSREFRAPTRGTTMPPPSTHEITPRQQQQIRQFRPSAPAPRMAPSAPAPRLAPSAPAPRMAPPAPAPRPAAPAPAPRPAAPAPRGGGGQQPPR